MTLHQSARAQSAIKKASARFQSAVVSIAEKEQKAQLKRRGHVLQAFGKWLDTAPRAATAADRKRITDYLAGLPRAVGAAEATTSADQRTASPECENRPVPPSHKD